MSTTTEVEEVKKEERVLKLEFKGQKLELTEEDAIRLKGHLEEFLQTDLDWSLFLT